MSDEPPWFTRAEVERIHMKAIDAAGGSHGLRDANLLESALARPRNQHTYGESDPFQLAAIYAEGIARNHAFVDGNKRTAWTAADVFLLKQGKYIQARQDDGHVSMMEALAQGQLSREDAAAYLRKHSRNREQEQQEQKKARQMQTYRLDEADLPADILAELKKGYQGEPTPELDHLLEDTPPKPRPPPTKPRPLTSEQKAQRDRGKPTRKR